MTKRRWAVLVGLYRKYGLYRKCGLTCACVCLRPCHSTSAYPLHLHSSLLHFYPDTQAVELIEQRASTIAQAGAPALRPSPVAEYGQLRLQQEYMSNSVAANLPPAACLFRDSALDRLTPGSSASAAIASRVRSLERQLFPARPALRRQPDGQVAADPELRAAVAAWVSFEIDRLQTQLMRQAQQVCHICAIRCCRRMLRPHVFPACRVHAVLSSL